MKRTGWPADGRLMQDDCRELSQWLSTRLGAKQLIERSAMHCFEFEKDARSGLPWIVLERNLAGEVVSRRRPTEAERMTYALHCERYNQTERLIAEQERTNFILNELLMIQQTILHR